MKIDLAELETIWKDQGLRFIEVVNGYVLEDANAHYPMVYSASEILQIYLSTSPLMKAMR